MPGECTNKAKRASSDQYWCGMTVHTLPQTSDDVTLFLVAAFHVSDLENMRYEVCAFRRIAIFLRVPPQLELAPIGGNPRSPVCRV